MPRHLDNRAVLVTGTGSGIGRTTALLAAKEGATIAAVDVDEAGLTATAETIRGTGGRISCRVADVAERHDLVAAIDALATEVGRTS